MFLSQSDVQLFLPITAAKSFVLHFHSLMKNLESQVLTYSARKSNRGV